MELNLEYILNRTDEKYHKMIKEINFNNFINTIKIFANDEYLDNLSVLYYLTKWAENKYWIYEKMGGLSKEIIINYTASNFATEELKALYLKYPLYSLWLKEILKVDNKMSPTFWTEIVFKDRKFGDMKVTTFFKKYLAAPEELITDISKLLNSCKLKGTYRLSIDPVDMMTAACSNYEWSSCYNIQKSHQGTNHSDGCLAAVLDSSSMIGYVYTKTETVEDVLGNIVDLPQKKLRHWINLTADARAMHIAKTYPNKDVDVPMKDCAQILVSEIFNMPNDWSKNEGTDYTTKRKYDYGFNEFKGALYMNTPTDERIICYNEKIVDPLEHERWLPPSDEINYCGYGFTLNNFEDCDYCEICDNWYVEGYCSHCDEDY